jgi:hypothetical protein
MMKRGAGAAAMMKAASEMITGAALMMKDAITRAAGTVRGVGASKDARACVAATS